MHERIFLSLAVGVWVSAMGVPLIDITACTALLCCATAAQDSHAALIDTLLAWSSVGTRIVLAHQRRPSPQHSSGCDGDNGATEEARQERGESRQSRQSSLEELFLSRAVERGFICLAQEELSLPPAAALLCSSYSGPQIDQPVIAWLLTLAQAALPTPPPPPSGRPAGSSDDDGDDDSASQSAAADADRALRHVPVVVATGPGAASSHARAGRLSALLRYDGAGAVNAPLAKAERASKPAAAAAGSCSAT